MKKLVTTIALALGLTVGSAGPSVAAEPTVVNADAFVVPDPSLDGSSMGNGIRLVGFEGVDWTLNGQPIEPTPTASTLWLPDGFTGTVTATAEPGHVLHEINANRTASELSWEHVVTPTRRAAETLAACIASQGRAAASLTQLEAEHSALVQTIAARDARIAEQRTTIRRLRAKLRALR